MRKLLSIKFFFSYKKKKEPNKKLKLKSSKKFKKV